MKQKFLLLLVLFVWGETAVQAEDGITGYTYSDELKFTTTRTGTFSFSFSVTMLDHLTDPALINTFPSIHIYWNGVKQEISWFDAIEPGPWKVTSPFPLEGSTEVVISCPIYHPIRQFVCTYSQITKIDFKPSFSTYKSAYIRNLDCYGNLLKTLDVSGLEHLEKLRCYSNQLTTLDASNNPNLEYLYCSSNQLIELNVSNTPNLEYLYCSPNQLKTLDVSSAPNLICLECNSNQLIELNVSNTPNLKELYCYFNLLTKLDVSASPNLRYLSCYSNQLTKLDVSGAPNLTRLECQSNQLAELDVCHCPNLEYLHCQSNQLTELNVSNNPKLRELHCSSNQLPALDISNNPNLRSFGCSFNKLAALDVSNNPNLRQLLCQSNQLTKLNVSNNPNLEYLYCYSNQLTALDVSNNLKLIDLHCYSNQLTALDVSNNLNLTDLHCYSNNILFSNLPEYPRKGIYRYHPQTTDIPSANVIDLSSEYDIRGNITAYKWLRSTNRPLVEGEEYSAQNGVFTFHNAPKDGIYCAMTNAAFPGLTITTNTIQLESQGIGQNDNANDPVVFTHYYDWQGRPVLQPQRGNIYIAKELRQSGKISVKKVIGND